MPTSEQGLTYEPTRVNRDLDLLYPKFRRALDGGLDACHDAGIHIDIFEAYRSPQRQDYLYAQGRSEPGKVVTWVKGWGSWHQYGLAADLARHDEKDWSWNVDYPRIAKIMAQYGISWGGEKDSPHFQMVPNMDMVMAQGLAKQFGVQWIWMQIK